MAKKEEGKEERPLLVGYHVDSSHYFERTRRGRYLAICGYVPERWTKPEEVEGRPDCPHCRRTKRERALDPDPRPTIERKLAFRWPNGLTTAQIRKLHFAVRREDAAKETLAALAKKRRIFYAETPSGRKVWCARRVVVEEYGRVFGMTGVTGKEEGDA